MNIHNWLAFFVSIFFGVSPMAASHAQQPASPMKGPDFVPGKVASWSGNPTEDGKLVLRDGSHWRLPRASRNYGPSRDFIEHALATDGEIFLSGDRASGLVDRVVTPRKLAVQEVSANMKEGRRAVLFYGPPSVYYLHQNRPWFGQALTLLQKSAAGTAFLDTPDLLVSMDTVTGEIMDVRPLSTR